MNHGRPGGLNQLVQTTWPESDGAHGRRPTVERAADVAERGAHREAGFRPAVMEPRLAS